MTVRFRLVEHFELHLLINKTRCPVMIYAAFYILPANMITHWIFDICCYYPDGKKSLLGLWLRLMCVWSRSMARTCRWSDDPITQNVTATWLPSQTPQRCTYFSEILLLNISESCYMSEPHTRTLSLMETTCSKLQYLASTGIFLQGNLVKREGQRLIIWAADDVRAWKSMQRPATKIKIYSSPPNL